MGNTFIAWCSATDVTDSLDHTWVESTSPADKFICFGGNTPEYKFGAWGADSKAHCKAKFCRGPMDSNYIAYGLHGVCHQATNRFLYPVGKTLNHDAKGRPRGYLASSLAYGPWGTTFATWLPTIYAPANIKCAMPWSLGDACMPMGTVEYEMEQVYINNSDDASETELLIRSTEILLNYNLQGLGASPIGKAQSEFVKEKENALVAVGLSTDSQTFDFPRLSASDISLAFSKINDIGKSLQLELRDKIGAESYRTLSGGTDTIYNLIDLDLAKQYYKVER